MITPEEAFKLLDEIKVRWREGHSGECRLLSLGNLCSCVICLCDQLHDFVKEREAGDLRTGS